MYRSRLRRPVRIPSISTSKSQTREYGFTGGLDTNSSNDEVSQEFWRYITDAREVEVGKWFTRKGADSFSAPVGEAVTAEQASTTGPGVFDFSTTTWWAKKVIPSSTSRVTAISANLARPSNATGSVVLALYSDGGGVPGVELFRTVIAQEDISSTAAYVKSLSITCPDVIAGTTHWIVGSVQRSGKNSYQISTTTAAATGKTSIDGGTTWQDASLDFNVKLHSSTAGGVKGHIRLTRPDGTNKTFFAHQTSVYEVNESTGAITIVDSGLNGSSTLVDFWYLNDTLYYTTGYQKLRKYNFVAASEVTTSPENAAGLIEHKGLLFCHSAVDPNKTFYSNFGLYDTFTSTDFYYSGAPRSSDPLKAFAKLNGILYEITRNNKYALYGSENSTFRLENAIGQKGTFSQRSVAYNEDRIYFASDDGIYVFNGAEDINICSRYVQNIWDSITLKENTVLELYNNRLYIFYTPAGELYNSRCLVRHLGNDVWESIDTKTFVGTSYTRFDQQDIMTIGSNRVGMLMIQEKPSNTYANMGEPLDWELRTHYNVYDTPAQLKRAPYFRPHFDTVNGDYNVSIGYATDFSESPTFMELSLAIPSWRYDSGARWDSNLIWGAAAQVAPLDTSMNVPGEWKRLQIRYKHSAAHEPVSFDGHVLKLQTQRIK